MVDTEKLVRALKAKTVVLEEKTTVLEKKKRNGLIEESDLPRQRQNSLSHEVMKWTKEHLLSWWWKKFYDQLISKK